MLEPGAVGMSSTMTTATSLTMTSGIPSTTDRSHLSKDENMAQAAQAMRSNLNRYARANDRRMILRSLKDVKFLSCLSLETVQPSAGPLSDLEREVAEETVILNGIPFKPVGFTSTGAARSSTGKVSSTNNNSCLGMLKGLCTKLCDREGVNIKPDDLYEGLIIRMARTTSSADAYFRLNSLLGSSDLMVMPVNVNQNVSGGTGVVAAGHGKDATLPANPIHLSLYVADGNVHMTLSAVYTFGLFRKSDVKPARPWISIQGLVNERTNFSNNNSVRNLNVKLPDLY